MSIKKIMKKLSNTEADLKASVANKENCVCQLCMSIMYVSCVCQYFFADFCAYNINIMLPGNTFI